MRIDHLIYAAPDLAAAVDALESRLGVRALPGGKHTGLGTHNALLGIGPDTYLELIAPDPDQPEPSTPRPFGVAGIYKPRMAGWALTCEDIDRAVAQARDQGYDPGDPIDAQRETATGTTLRWRLTLNALTGGPVPFLISWGDTEHPARSAPQQLRLEAFRLEHPDPPSVTPALAALGADVEVRQADDVALVARLSGPNGSVVLR